MPVYELAVKKQNKHDCLMFMNEETAKQHVRGNQGYTYEKRDGYAVLYNQKAGIKTTVVEEKTLDAVIEALEKIFISSQYTIDYEDLSYRGTYPYLLVGTHTEDGYAKDYKFIFLDASEQEVRQSRYFI